MDAGDVVVLLLAVAATLVTAALLVSFLRAERPRGERPHGRVDRRRRGGDRRRDPREALALVGNALAAAHDPRTLLPVVLEVIVEATGAAGGRLYEGERELAWIGEEASGPPFELRLGPLDEGDVVVQLHEPPGGLSPGAQDQARWLGSQAAIALENAHLHHVVQRQAATDELTGLVNRRRFMEALTAEIARRERFGGSLVLVLADLDDFKRINDRFGHLAGDDALRVFAGVLTAQLRDVDVAGRLGGEEFAVLLPETELEGGLAVARRIRVAVGAAPLGLPGAEEERLTASLGVAEHAEGTAEDLLRRADTALYRAKAEGKNRVEAA